MLLVLTLRFQFYGARIRILLDLSQVMLGMFSYNPLLTVAYMSQGYVLLESVL